MDNSKPERAAVIASDALLWVSLDVYEFSLDVDRLFMRVSDEDMPPRRPSPIFSGEDR
ncbi:MAG: hypothetical protein ABI155_15275 [Paralcaligenes sp.]